MTDLLTRISEAINVNLEDTRSDYLKVKKSQKEIVKQIFGKKHTGEDWSVRECMNKISGRTLTDDDFDQLYPLYALGFETGRGVGLASKKHALEFMSFILKPKKPKKTEAT